MSASSPVGPRSKCLIHPYFDFWFLGGASIALWVIMITAGQFRFDSQPVETRFLQVGATFALLSLLCNHPHFLVSYRFGYARGGRFILRHWIALICAPLLLLALLVTAFVYSDGNVGDNRFVELLNHGFEFSGVGYRFGEQMNLGDDLLGLSIWFMSIAVGWHYAKQVFGCMMVYAFYRDYPLSPLQKKILKASLFAVAFLQFTYLFSATKTSLPGNLLVSQMSYSITSLGLPIMLKTFATIVTAILFSAAVVFVFMKNYFAQKRLPPINFLVPWIAIYVWWVPLFLSPEFTFLMVPFFHSLQYLPFAWRLESPRIGRGQWYYTNLTIRILILVIAGFLAFDLIPSLLDTWFKDASLRTSGFFLIAFAVFLNLHHFFIDSVVWRFDQPEVKNSLLHDPAGQRV